MASQFSPGTYDEFEIAEQSLRRPRICAYRIDVGSVVRTRSYRILHYGRLGTVDAQLRIDLVGASGFLKTTRVNGWHGFPVFRKSLEYQIRADDSIIIQLSNSGEVLVRLPIVPI